MKRILIALLITVLLVVGCSDEKKEIVIASKPMTEQYIITEMLKALIEEHTDIEVTLKEGIGGGTANIHPALIKGDIDLYPEYTGTGWMFVLKHDPIFDQEKLYQEVKDAYLSEYDLVWSELYGFNDTFGLAMKVEKAQALGISTYSDLAKVASQLTFGAEYDFYEREDGFDGLVDAYGFAFKDIKEMDIGLKYEAIGQDEVDLINVFSTDGRLEAYGLKVLDDDANFFPSYHAASVIREETLETYPELSGVLTMMDGILSNDDMTKLNYEVEVNHKSAKEVAKNYLVEKGLLEKHD